MAPRKRVGSPAPGPRTDLGPPKKRWVPPRMRMGPPWQVPPFPQNYLTHTVEFTMARPIDELSGGQVGHCKNCGFADVLDADGVCSDCPVPPALPVEPMADTHQWSEYEDGMPTFRESPPPLR